MREGEWVHEFIDPIDTPGIMEGWRLMERINKEI